MQVQRTLKRREGVWGIVKGDKGETIMTRKHTVLAMASSPPVPLDEIYKDWNHKRCFASLNMTIKFLCTLPLVIASR